MCELSGNKDSVNCAGKAERQSLWKAFPCVLLMHLGVSQELLLQGWEHALHASLVLCPSWPLLWNCSQHGLSLSANWEWGGPAGTLFYVVWMSWAARYHRAIEGSRLQISCNSRT